MAKLPDVADLGPLRATVGPRPIARYDPSGIARAGVELGRDVGEGGAAIARAVGAGGTAFGRAVGEGGARLARATEEGGLGIAGAIAKGGAQIGAGEREFGKGLDAAGEGALNYQLDKNRWQFAQANSAFLTDSQDLNSRYEKDTNYGTLADRYGDDLGKIRDKAAALIEDPNMRERFAISTDPEVAAAMTRIKSRATALEGNASTAWAEAQGDRAIDRAIDQGAGASDPQLQGRLVQSQNALYDGLVAKGTITPVQALQMKQAWAHRYAIADGIARSKTDPVGVLNDLRAAPGSDEAIVNRIIEAEGNGQNPRSSANGVGQIVDGTWLGLIKKYRPDLAQGASDQDLLAMRADRALGRDMVGKLLEENRSYLKGQGITATAGDLYLAHFLGPKAAAAVINADPKAAVNKVLAAAVGDDRAGAMIAANPDQLMGQQAGSVRQWADDRMGGAAAGGVHIYDILRPDQRALLYDHAERELHRQTVSDLSGLKARVDDTVSEAMRTGIASKPVTQSEFIGALGPVAGLKAHKAYQDELTFGGDVNRLAGMAPSERESLLAQYLPKAGSENYAAQGKRYDQLTRAVGMVEDEKRKDPAAFAIKHMPASGEAFDRYVALAGDPTADPEQRKALAADYATRTQLDQEHVGVPASERRLLPKPYADALTKAITTAADSDDPKARVAVIGQIKSQHDIWGDHWGDVMRQLAPAVQPVVRAIAADADETAMTRLLSLPKDEAQRPSRILAQQNDTKWKDLTTELNNSFAPFRGTLVGRQLDRDYPGYLGLAQELGALYVRDGKSAGDAAAAAFKDLVGGRYEFRDSWRMPKTADVSADDVQAGTVAARTAIANAGENGTAFGIKPAIDDIGLGATNRVDSLTKFARDGKFVTAHDNSGLNLVYDGKFVRGEDGAPLVLNWSLLAAFGKGAKDNAAFNVPPL